MRIKKKRIVSTAGMGLILVMLTRCALFIDVRDGAGAEIQTHPVTGNYLLKGFSGESGLNYCATFPADYGRPEEKNTGAESFPLIIFLHGMEERGTDLDLVLCHHKSGEGPGMGRGLGSIALAEHDFHFITVSPLCPEKTGWPLITSRLGKLITHIADSFRIDESRIYITGVSMGGMGTWSMAMKYPDLFAAGRTGQRRRLRTSDEQEGGSAEGYACVGFPRQA